MWQEIGDGRWTWTGDDERHLLLHDGDRLVELHDRTAHVYTAGEVDRASPLDRAVHRRTVAVDLDAVDDGKVWLAMAAYGEG
jgi:hypothetical protein